MTFSVPSPSSRPLLDFAGSQFWGLVILTWHLRKESYLTRTGVPYFGHFLGALREPRQLKPQGEPLQLEAFSAIEGTSVPATGGPFPLQGIGSPCGGICSPYGPLLIV